MSRVFGIGCALCVAWAGVGHAQTPPDTSAVRQTVAAFADTWNRHDMAAFGQLFARDADFVNVAATWWKGRRAIERNHAFAHGVISRSDTAGLTSPPRVYGIFRHSTMTFTSIAIRLPRPDLAIAHVAWRLAGDARTTGLRTGMLSFVLVPTAGRWRIVAAQNTEIHRSVH